MRLEAQAPASGRNDGLNALWCQPRAEGVVVIGPVRDQAGQGRASPSFDPGPGLGAVMALAARQAQTQGAAPLIRQDVDLGAEAAPAATESGIQPLFLGRTRCARVRSDGRAVQQPRGQLRLGLHISHQVWPNALNTPVGVAAIHLRVSKRMAPG